MRLERYHPLKVIDLELSAQARNGFALTLKRDPGYTLHSLWMGQLVGYLRLFLHHGQEGKRLTLNLPFPSHVAKW